jgi:hypothetical protein
MPATRIPKRSASALVALLALGLALDANAQQVPAGTRVRFTTPMSFVGWHVGQVTAMTRDSVRVIDANGDSASIPLANVGLMDSSGGIHTPLWATLASVVTVPAGATAGIVGSIFVAAAAGSSIDRYMEEGLWVGATSGLIAGVAIAVTHRYEAWNPVLLPMPSGRVVATSADATMDARPYRPRARLKLRVEGRKVIGTLVEQHDDSIVLAWNSGQTAYPIASVSDVHISRGKSAWTGAKFGAVIGAGVGLINGVFQASEPNDAHGDPVDSGCENNTQSCRYESDLARAANHVVGYAIVGAIAGAVIRRERWVKGELPAPNRESDPARLLLAPGRDGVRIGVHATF